MSKTTVTRLGQLLDKKIHITQVKSGSKLTKRIQASVTGLGLKGIGSNSTLFCSNDVLGMVRKVAHIIKIQSA